MVTAQLIQAGARVGVETKRVRTLLAGGDERARGALGNVLLGRARQRSSPEVDGSRLPVPPPRFAVDLSQDLHVRMRELVRVDVEMGGMRLLCPPSEVGLVHEGSPDVEEDRADSGSDVGHGRRTRPVFLCLRSMPD